MPIGPHTGDHELAYQGWDKDIEIHYINEKIATESEDFSKRADGLYIFDNIIGDMGKFLFLKHTQLVSPKDMHEIKV